MSSSKVHYYYPTSLANSTIAVTTSDGHNGNFSAGSIVGIVIGVLIAITIMVVSLVMAFLIHKKKRQKTHQERGIGQCNEEDIKSKTIIAEDQNVDKMPSKDTLVKMEEIEIIADDGDSSLVTA
ncbi:MAG: hypothetical protein EXX96DRAFT_537106 [Benjaminiella poitrasii]|nr:MAG: hypothetical protein EXX96DRAFT_537106 [Benjaminiella poitrasii]